MCDGALRWAPSVSRAEETVPEWAEPPHYTFVVDSSCGERSFIGRYAAATWTFFALLWTAEALFDAGYWLGERIRGWLDWD